MRKRVMSSGEAALPQKPAGAWLDLESVAEVSLTSEDAAHPFENALEPGEGKEWRAAGPGAQTIRLEFDPPRRITRIQLRFAAGEGERSQEFAITAVASDGRRTEVVRQQWNFSPGGAGELEDYTVALDAVAQLAIWIDPDRGRNRFAAALAELRVG